ncbi:MAG: hypothetical protein ABSE90_06085 [Verrucomicrobiota bacterium]|jgi:hypothetical protein
MFLPPEEIEPDVLRQGDIIAEVPILGAIQLEKYAPVVDASWAVGTKPESGFCMVLSHSCEIALENEIKVTSLILAPIRDVIGAAKPEQFDLLKQSNVLTKDTATSFLKYFYVEPAPPMPFAKGGLVDYSKLFSLRRHAVKNLVPKKVLQLKPEFVAAMAKKLAIYFYRIG